jgi:membrane dipeptidase
LTLRPTTKNIIDLHCDALFKGDKRGCGLKGGLQFSPEKLPPGFRLFELLAAYVPDSLRGEKAERHFLRLAELFHTEAQRCGIAEVEALAAIPAALEQSPVAAALAIEGGAALNGKLENIERFFNLGVRLITLTWNAENELGGGAGTDISLKAFGRAAVTEMERLGIVVDASHLSERAFWDLCETARRPFIASHSNARAICNHRRNLTDEMFAEIKRRGGIAGVCFHRDFIREDGENGSINDLLRHVHHFLERGGENTLALGSDFDGCDPPDYLSEGIGRFAYLAECMERSGIPAAIIEKIMFENAKRYFIQLTINN